MRTFARTASHIPTYPVTALKTAPMMNATERPNLIENSECTAFSGAGRMKNRMTVSSPRNTASVRNWRERYAFAPSWIARAISFIFSVPSGAASTSRTR